MFRSTDSSAFDCGNMGKRGCHVTRFGRMWVVFDTGQRSSRETVGRACHRRVLVVGFGDGLAGFGGLFCRVRGGV